jgi:hypothetical protein
MKSEEITPKEDLITIEALEKEPGWEKGTYEDPRIPIPLLYWFKGPIQVTFNPLEVTIEDGFKFEGCSTMQDIRTLDRLVNG